MDNAIVETCFSRLLETTIPSSTSVAVEDTRACRLLEIAEVLHGNDGEAYARRLQQVLIAAKGETEGQVTHVLEGTVTSVLTRLQNGMSLSFYVRFDQCLD